MVPQRHFSHKCVTPAGSGFVSIVSQVTTGWVFGCTEKDRF